MGYQSHGDIVGARAELPRVRISPGHRSLIDQLAAQPIDEAVTSADRALAFLGAGSMKLLRGKGASIALEPANPSYETRIFGPDRVKVQGRLVGLVRKY